MGDGLGLTYVRAVVRWAGRSHEVDLLVDSGIAYTVLKKKVTLILADRTRIERPLSEAILELPGHGEYHTPVILGEEGDENPLGTVTLGDIRSSAQPAQAGAPSHEGPLGLGLPSQFLL